MNNGRLFRRRRSFVWLVCGAVCLAIGFPAASATATCAVDIALGGNWGASPQDTVYLGVPHRFDLWIQNDFKAVTMDLGFKISSPDGVTWSWTNVGGWGPGGLGTGQACVTVVEGSRMWPPETVWDSDVFGFPGVKVFEKNFDGVDPDTIRFVSMSESSTSGLPAGPSQHMMSLHFKATSIGGGETGTICIDSAYVPVGSWIFVDETGKSVRPNINGPYCWPVIEVDLCSFDSDDDGFGDPGHPENYCPTDNCPTIPNRDQIDSDGDGVGDACDNCPGNANAGQINRDGDNYGDACDHCPTLASADNSDTDGDGVGNACDNCPETPNTNQTDMDGDHIGDACDDYICGDVNGDGNADVGDAVYMINFIFRGGNPPCAP